MAISETKMQMVIANYFKDECDVNTSIRQAFEKGFRIGVKKGAISTDRPQGEWIYTNNPLRLDDEWACNRCGNISFVKTNFCDRCGARMKGADDE